MVFDFSYDTLLRMVDVLRVRYDDVFNPDGSVKQSFTLQEQKTGKDRTIWLDVNGVADELKKYRQELNKEHMSKWIFPVKHPSIHTVRKASAWHFYVTNNYDIGALMKLLNHSSESATLHYIGESQKTLHDKLKNSFRH